MVCCCYENTFFLHLVIKGSLFGSKFNANSVLFYYFELSPLNMDVKLINAGSHPVSDGNFNIPNFSNYYFSTTEAKLQFYFDKVYFVLSSLFAPMNNKKHSFFSVQIVGANASLGFAQYENSSISFGSPYDNSIFSLINSPSDTSFSFDISNIYDFKEEILLGRHEALFDAPITNDFKNLIPRI